MGTIVHCGALVPLLNENRKCVTLLFKLSKYPQSDMEFDTSEGVNNYYGTSLIVFETLAVLIQAVSVIFNGAIISTLWKKSLFNCPSNK